MMPLRTALAATLLLALASAGCEREATLPDEPRARLVGALDGRPWTGDATVVFYPDGRITVVATRTRGGTREVFQLRAIDVEGGGHRLIADPHFDVFMVYREGNSIPEGYPVRAGTLSFDVLAPNGMAGGRAVGTFDVVIAGPTGPWRFRGSFDAWNPHP